MVLTLTICLAAVCVVSRELDLKVMSTRFAVPAALEEFLGHRQTKVEASSVLALGVLLTVIYAALFSGSSGTRTTSTAA